MTSCRRSRRAAEGGRALAAHWGITVDPHAGRMEASLLCAQTAQTSPYSALLRSARYWDAEGVRCCSLQLTPVWFDSVLSDEQRTPSVVRKVVMSSRESSWAGNEEHGRPSWEVSRFWLRILSSPFIFKAARWSTTGSAAIPLFRAGAFLAV